MSRSRKTSTSTCLYTVNLSAMTWFNTSVNSSTALSSLKMAGSRAMVLGKFIELQMIVPASHLVLKLRPSPDHRFGCQPAQAYYRPVEQLRSERHQTPHEGHAHWPCHHPQLVIPSRRRLP